MYYYFITLKILISDVWDVYVLLHRYPWQPAKLPLGESARQLPYQVRCRNSPVRGWGWDPRRQSTWESQSGRFRLPLRSGPSQIIFGKVSSRREKRALGPGPGRWIPWTRQIHGCHNERFQQTLLLPAVFLSQNVNNNRWPSVYSDFSIYKTILGT